MEIPVAYIGINELKCLIVTWDFLIAFKGFRKGHHSHISNYDMNMYGHACKLSNVALVTIVMNLIIIT